MNTRYSWQFDDGTPDSAWSSSPDVTHTFTTPGIHYVTVWATDDTRRHARRDDRAGRATCRSRRTSRPSSSNVAIESRATGNARLWVVNQDNDSVTVFDAVTRAKVKEIAVGTCAALDRGRAERAASG